MKKISKKCPKCSGIGKFQTDNAILPPVVCNLCFGIGNVSESTDRRYFYFMKTGKILSVLLLVVSMVFAQYNYSGYADTAAVSNFNADSTGTTRAFEMSQYEDLRVYAMSDDTSEAGYDSDSIKYAWGIQLGNIVRNSSGVKDTTWQERYTVDTFDILTAGNLALHYYNIDSSGYYQKCRLFIDTLSVTGWAVQDREPFNRGPKRPWAPVYRFWYIGLTGNITGSYVELIFGQTRRVYNYVHQQ